MYMRQPLNEMKEKDDDDDDSLYLCFKLKT